MRSTAQKSPLSGVWLSSVVPGEITPGDKDHHELTSMDLALKLHYVKGVYFFKSEAVQGLTTLDLKEPMFPLLALYYPTSGRIRQSEEGRPFVKCNDGGVRIAEAYCDKTIEEWLKMKEHGRDDCLLYDHVLGPDLGYSPLVLVQFTRFKCGGMCVGLSWAHVIGDPFSASSFINMWGRILQGHLPPKSLHLPAPRKSDSPPSAPRKPFLVKKVDPVGDLWLATNNKCKMGSHSFHLTGKQLDDILGNISVGVNQTAKVSYFEVLSAMVWKSLAKVREDSGPRTVTICANKHNGAEFEEMPSNKMVFSIVQADVAVAKSDVDELAVLIAEKQEEENSLIEELLEVENGKGDYIAYGANLTFLKLEDANIYELELNGHKPTFANYTINGVGDEGAVLVLPGPPCDGSEKPGDGRTVTVVFPENQLSELLNVLRNDWDLA